MARLLAASINRSKFNTALWIEAQGFCMIKRDN